MTAVSHLLLLCGASFMLLAAVGVVRFSDVLARMHSLSKATTLGLVLVLIGGAFGLRDSNDITYLLLGGACEDRQNTLVKLSCAAETTRVYVAQHDAGAGAGGPEPVVVSIHAPRAGSDALLG